MIAISGTATKRMLLDTTPAAGVTVNAYRNSDANTSVAMATSDANGMYTMTITTGGTAIDGYLKATLAGFVDTYLYPPAPLTADFDSASLNMVDQNTIDVLSGTFCGSQQEATNAVVAVLVVDANNAPIGGASVSSSPEAVKNCYNAGGGGVPDKTATVTDTDGIAYLVNLPAGQVTVSASKSGLSFSSHEVNARAGVLTTTVIQ